jgi:small subunit ribosomal protein S19e
MVSVYDVPADKLIMKAAEDLKTKIKAPEFAPLVKTGKSRERAPIEEDWWYVRVAATLRKYYTKEAIGVNLLRGYFGGKQERGAAPAKFARGSGKIARLSAQQLEKEGFIVKADKGRKITPKGRAYLDKFAQLVAEEAKKPKA